MAVTLSTLLQWTGGKVANEAALGERVHKIEVQRISPLGVSRPDSVTFFFSKAYQNDLMKAAPAVLITGSAFLGPLEKSGLPLWKESAVIVCHQPYLAMAILSEKFASIHEFSHVPSEITIGETEIHPTAVIHPSVELGKGVKIGAHCVLEAKVKLGDGCVLYPSCYLGPQVTVGERSVLFPRVALYEKVSVGKRARLHAGVVIGSDGLGFAPKFKEGNPDGHQKIYHLGSVQVGDDVEMGANTCIDRGTFSDTVIGNQVKLDNQVHVGHNAKVEDGAILCGGVALAGNAHIGRFAYVGGLTGVTNHVHVGDGAKVGAVSLVTKDVPQGQAVVGNPQRDYQEHFRAHAALNKLIRKKKPLEK